MFSEEHLFSIALRRCNLIGDINFYKLVNLFGSAKEVWNLKNNTIKTPGLGRKMIGEIGNPVHLEFAEKELTFCEKNKIRILLRHQNNLPGFLTECIDAPAILYCKGNIPQAKSYVSIVGTRKMTTYGKHFVTGFLSLCKDKNVTTVSGLAYGVDAEVHTQSIENEIPTLAVMAHGLHLIYPAKHKALSEKIIEKGGAIISEFNSSHPPDRENFIKRNRIVAGISPTTIVVETGFGGGSMSTATFANDYNRDVFALPGKISDKYSQGCNMLIRQNKATIISGVGELVNELFPEANNKIIRELFPKAEHEKLPENQKTIYRIIFENPGISIEDLSEKVEMNPFQILPDLLHLEILNFIKANSEKCFFPI